MIQFDLWRETFIFAAVFAPLIIVPCILVAVMGRKMINQLGMFPTQTPIIQLSIFWKLVVTEIVTFVCLIAFFQFFSAK